MTIDAARLGHECDVFTRYLTRRPATPYIVGKYVEAHRAHPSIEPVDPFGRRLVDRAASGATMARLADAYARRAEPRGALRKKLVLLLAILETAPGSHQVVDRAPSRSIAGAVGSLAVSGLVGVAAAMAGLLIFGVARLFTKDAAS
jgi:hypothetical protein